MNSDDTDPIDVWGVIDRTRAVELEDRLRRGSVSYEFQTIGGDLVGQGSQGGVVAALDTGEVVFVKRSDRSVQGVELGAIGVEWVRNEAAAYLIAKRLGYEDIVMPTVLRCAEIDDVEVEVAVRLYVEPTGAGDLSEGAPLAYIERSQLARAAIFDYLVEQSDRVVDGLFGGNWYILREPDREPRLLLFDHQQCFGSRAGFGLRSAMWDTASHLIAPFLDPVAALLNEAFEQELGALLAPHQVDGVMKRARVLVRRLEGDANQSS